jgi:hypothetical protein
MVTLRLPLYISTVYVHKIDNIPEIKIHLTTLLQQSITRARIDNDKITEDNLLQIQLQIEMQ